MTWDLQEFRDHCSNRELPDTRIYQSTLYAKHWRAQMFSKKAVSAWEDLFATHDEISTEDPEWEETWLMAESYAEAALQALHTMADVLAQIVNVVVLNRKFSEDIVTMKKVKRRLQQNKLAPNVYNAIQQFLASYEFRYTDGFVNTIKHRRLIESEFRIEGGAEIEYREGLRFKQFSYKGEDFTEMWNNEISDILIPGFIDGITTICISINEWLV